jgi:hypothetical protein
VLNRKIKTAVVLVTVAFLVWLYFYLFHQAGMREYGWDAQQEADYNWCMSHGGMASVQAQQACITHVSNEPACKEWADDIAHYGTSLIPDDACQ